MSREEFYRIAKAIKELWKTQSLLDSPEAMSLWFEMLQDLDYQMACGAVKSYACCSHFAPTIADIREHALKVSAPSIPSGSEQWGKVQKAIMHYGCNNIAGAMRGFDELTKQAIDDAGGWRFLCVSENPTADRARFLQAYESRAKRMQEEAKLTPELKANLQKLIGESNVKQLK